MLRGEGLTFAWERGAAPVLDHVSIELAPGTVTGLRGPSGCGKSTLGAVLGGLRRPQHGTVTVDDVAFTTSRGVSSMRGPWPVQVVLQHPERAMNPRWRIREVLAEAFDGRRSEALERVTAAVEREADASHGLVSSAWLDRFPHEISGGELQRVNLARALWTRPKYLVADEISASLDAITQTVLWHRLAHEVEEQGLGVLAISHDTPLLEQVATSVLQFSDL